MAIPNAFKNAFRTGLTCNGTLFKGQDSACHGYGQVLRGSSLQAEQAGSSWTDQEKEDWEGAGVSFLRRRSANSKANSMISIAPMQMTIVLGKRAGKQFDEALKKQARVCSCCNARKHTCNKYIMCIIIYICWYVDTIRLCNLALFSYCSAWPYLITAILDASKYWKIQLQYPREIDFARPPTGHW